MISGIVSEPSSPSAVSLAEPDWSNLSLSDGLNIGIWHASTVFSQGAFSADGALSPSVKQAVSYSKELGQNAWYVVGALERGAFSSQILPFFSQEWPGEVQQHIVGPSVFSVDFYRPFAQIGSWKEFQALVSELRKIDIEIIPDFIPNTIGVGSPYVIKCPQLILDHQFDQSELDWLKAQTRARESSDSCIYHRDHKLFPKQSDLSSNTFVHRIESDSSEIVHFQRFLASGQSAEFWLRRGVGSRKEEGFSPYAYMEIQKTAGAKPEAFCKYLGREALNAGSVWGDVFLYDLEGEVTQNLHRAYLRQLSAVGIQHVRADMAHLPSSSYWKAVLSGCRLEVIGESYYQHNHSRLQSLGLSTYASDFREALRHGSVRDVQAHFFEDQKLTLLKSAVAYVANHDDPHGTASAREGALNAALVLSPSSRVMFAQGQHSGIPQKFGSDVHMTMEEFDALRKDHEKRDPDFARFMRTIGNIGKLAVLRDSVSKPFFVESTNYHEGLDKLLIVGKHHESSGHSVIGVVDLGGIENFELIIDLKRSVPGGSFSEVLDLVNQKRVPIVDGKLKVKADHSFSSHIFLIK